MFVDTGLPRLFHAAYNLGADRSRLIGQGRRRLAIAGPEQGVFNIGERNFQALWPI